MNEELLSQSQEPLTENERAKLRLKALLSRIGRGIASGTKEAVQHPIPTIERGISTTGSSLLSLLRGGLASIPEMGATVAEAYKALPVKIVMPFAPYEKREKPLEDIASFLRRTAKTIRGEPKTPVQKVASFVGETALPFFFGGEVAKGLETTTRGIRLVGRPLSWLLRTRGVRFGVELAVANQLLYNPLSTEEGQAEVSRLTQAKRDFITGLLFGGATKIAEPFLKIPLKVASIPIEKVFTAIQKRITDDYYRVLSPVIPDIIKQTDIYVTALERMAKRMAERGETIDQYEVRSIASRDFLDIIQGKKRVTPIFNVDFWKDIAKKYGLSPENYPVEITLPVYKVDTQVYKTGVAGLLKSPDELVNEFKDFLIDTAQKQAKVNGRAIIEDQLPVIGMMVEELGKKGYSVSLEQAINFVDRATQFIREDARFVYDIGERDQLLSTYNTLRDRLPDFFTDLQRLKLYLGRFDEEKAFNAWSKYLSRKGVGVDEVFEELRQANIVRPDETLSPQRIIEIVRSIPSKKDIPVVRPPEPFNIKDEFFKLLTPKEKIVEQPYVVPKSVAEKTGLQALLEKEKTITENAKDNIISKLPVNKQVEYKTIKGIIDSSPLSPEEKLTVSKFYDNLYIVSAIDPNDTTQLLNAFDAIKSQSKIWTEEIKTIANYGLDDGSKKVGKIASVVEGLKNFLSGNPRLRDLVSSQNKLTSAKLGKPAAYMNFMYSNVNPLRFLSEKTRAVVTSLIPEEEKSIFAKAYEEGKINTLSEGSQKAAKIWQAYSDTILSIINDLRIELGKDPIPKVDRYFPRQLSEVLVEAMNDAVKKDTLFTPEGTNHFLSRTLQSLGALHSTNPDTAMSEYVRQTNFHIEYLLKELIKRETRHWDEELQEQL